MNTYTQDVMHSSGQRIPLRCHHPKDHSKIFNEQWCACAISPMGIQNTFKLASYRFSESVQHSGHLKLSIQDISQKSIFLKRSGAKGQGLPVQWFERGQCENPLKSGWCFSWPACSCRQRLYRPVCGCCAASKPYPLFCQRRPCRRLLHGPVAGFGARLQAFVRIRMPVAGPGVQHCRMACVPK